MNDFAGSWIALWPVAASHYARQVDWLFWGLVAVSLTVSVPPFIATVVFVLRYRAGRPADRRGPPRLLLGLEIAWMAVPILLGLACFVVSALMFQRAEAVPAQAQALTIDVVARQWMFKFQHPGGRRELDELHVPAGTPVLLTMTSQDVIHSFYVPALRLKQDVLPGRRTTLWFNADRPGTYYLHCAEFCGTFHSRMGTRLVVMPPADFQRWLGRSGADPQLVAEGAALFRARGCSGCHLGGGPVRAPSLQGIYGRPVALASGQLVIADEAYLRDSILQPSRQLVAGYQDRMPSFQGALSESDLLRLITYIQSLGDD
jgi:cytochrome c oxidase subunit 2